MACYDCPSPLPPFHKCKHPRPRPRPPPTLPNTTLSTTTTISNFSSPSATSPPVRIPHTPLPLPLPSILTNGDTTPGTIHHRSDTITAYHPPWQHGLARIAADEALIAARRVPEGRGTGLGVRAPPGFENGRGEKVVRREVLVVEEGEVGWMCERERRMWVWERKEIRGVNGEGAGCSEVERGEMGMASAEGRKEDTFEDSGFDELIEEAVRFLPERLEDAEGL